MLVSDVLRTSRSKTRFCSRDRLTEQRLDALGQSQLDALRPPLGISPHKPGREGTKAAWNGVKKSYAIEMLAVPLTQAVSEREERWKR